MDDEANRDRLIGIFHGVSRLSMRARLTTLFSVWTILMLIMLSTNIPHLVAYLEGAAQNQSQEESQEESGQLREKEIEQGFYLGFNPDEISMLRYKCTASTSQRPEPSWTVVLGVTQAKATNLTGKGVYDMERSSTDWDFGGPNVSFSMDEKGNLVREAVVETSEMREAISGSGYFQEILPLPGKTVLVGETWNVSLHFNLSVALANRTAFTMGNGTIRCRVVRKKTVSTSAGSFSVVEVESHASTSQTSWLIMANGTRRTLPGCRFTANGTHMVDIETGIVVLGATEFEHASLLDTGSASVAQLEESYPCMWRPFPALVELVEVVPGKRSADA